MSADSYIAGLGLALAVLSLWLSARSLRIAHRAEITARKPVLVFVYMTAGDGWGQITMSP